MCARLGGKMICGIVVMYFGKNSLLGWKRSKYVAKWFVGSAEQFLVINFDDDNQSKGFLLRYCMYTYSSYQSKKDAFFFQLHQ